MINVMPLILGNQVKLQDAAGRDRASTLNDALLSIEEKLVRMDATVGFLVKKGIIDSEELNEFVEDYIMSRKVIERMKD